uniref:aminotransferase class III-fold pyridoxal phosphate-dependent enzyme n=1 Tax=Candidatus Pelagibacter sp. TaxID=2024849 RepID=UPI003F86EC95
NKNPELFLENKFFKRNYGLNKINKKYSFFEAEKIIPTGNQMLSKNPKYILPNQWPLYYKKANGCMITSLDGKKYYDFSLMGVGTNILGYSNKIVDNFVKKKIDCGSMSTLNCFEELDLAKELIQMNKWADMVRFARTGGEINSIAIRIARAAAGKDKVAFCGYHGWHDWYLSANLKNKKNLNNHLMSGFFTSGVPKFLSNKSYTFKFNDINSVKKLIALDKNIGVIKLEVYRNIEPKRSFLKELRKICDKEKIVLIFDECTSGFRSNYGGIYQKYGITPDIVLFGKALGNGYPITACVGKKEVMENVKSSFISSTFWSERIGFSAGLITLKEMRKINSWNKITNIGKYIRRGLSNVAKQHGLKIEFLGLPALTNFQFKTKNSEYLNAYLTQEMLKRGYLFSNSIYTSVAHEEDIVNNYLDNLNDILDNISGNISEKNYLINNLNGPLPKKPFNRMN